MAPDHRRTCLLTLALIGLACTTSVWAQSEDREGPGPAKSELQIEYGQSVGNMHLFAYAENRKIHIAGIEYDRHCFGRLFKADFNYMAEVLPLVLMDEPAQYGTNGKALTFARRQRYGGGFTPLGLRLLWRRPGQFQPYFNVKGGFLFFRDPVLSSDGTRMNFSAEFSLGIERAVTHRIGFRAGYSDFHISNGNIGQHNPGIDFMHFNGALTLRFDK